MSVLTLSSMSDGLRVRDASLVVFCGAMRGRICPSSLSLSGTVVPGRPQRLT